ncbi:MAG: acetyl-CoA carboxylase biotin carboxylase subunit [Candidatus Coatesbacteria bacterium]|nr:MAG: acetyl-CoA carboxylase biotin carboxylase subunit [Candidatus Coatesbacteria bacterium]
MFSKILIANRGEIAARIIRACRELGIPAAAIYSEADRASLHVAMADEAVCVGPAPALESYLDIDKVVGAAKELGCCAIHPGYGFLAENHLFARRCEKEDITFIGPPSDALELVGSKLAARAAVTAVGVPVIPGMSGHGKDAAHFKKEAKAIGYPVLVKAAAGGGGKGMRVVETEKDLAPAVEGAAREAKGAFGDDTIYLEKCIVRPRHVEFQVFADFQGNAVHLFERECSIQRRHQKIVEETPSPALTTELRAEMGEAALKVVEASGYKNAGTVEFLLDPDGNYYFLEVNARIQVEHPITEMVVGVDLVAEQIRVAAGEPLSFEQGDLSQRGHAIECRIYAEDPASGFLPAAGPILLMEEPQGPGIRVDSGVYSGGEVSVHYDPIMAKLIAWGPDREAARRRMSKALGEYPILGIETTVGFLKDVIEHPEFIDGNTHTGFIDEQMADWRPTADDELLATALTAAALYETEPKAVAAAGKEVMSSPWETVGNWEIGSGR